MSERARWVVAWVCALLPLLGWWSSGLFDLDEGFYAAVVGEMLRRHEWVTPFYNGSPWFEKPILLYWLAKPCVALFGPMFGPRLPSVLCGVGVLALTSWFARRHFGEKVAQMSLLVLGSSLLFSALGRLMMTDMPLTLCLVAGWLCLWEWLTVGGARWPLVAGLAIGLGVLAKGPVALILFGIVALWSIYRQDSDPKRAWSGVPAFGLACCLVVASWYLPAYLASGQLFVQKFLVEQNVGRFTGGDPAHTLGGFASLALYVPVLLLGMLPWSLWIPSGFLRRSEGGAPGPFLACCAATVFVFFTISGAKLPHYILPMLPPMAILVSARLARSWAFPIGVGFCVAVAIGVNILQSWYYRASGQGEAHALAQYIHLHAGADQVALYQLGRRESDRGTGSLRIRETSLPSMLFYLDRNVIDTDDFVRVVQAKGQVWIFTRADRLKPDDFLSAQKLGRTLEELHPPGIVNDSYRLYVLR